MDAVFFTTLTFAPTEGRDSLIVTRDAAVVSSNPGCFQLSSKYPTHSRALHQPHVVRRRIAKSYHINLKLILLHERQWLR